MERKYLSFLSGFLNDSIKDRLLFELNSNKKRNNAFSKISVFSDCFNDKHIFCDLSHLTDSAAIERLKQLFGNISCYDLVYGCLASLSDAYIRAVNSYMVDILIIDENSIIYIGECEHGASSKFILKK